MPYRQSGYEPSAPSLASLVRWSLVLRWQEKSSPSGCVVMRCIPRLGPNLCLWWLEGRWRAVGQAPSRALRAGHVPRPDAVVLLNHLGRNAKVRLGELVLQLVPQRSALWVRQVGVHIIEVRQEKEQGESHPQ